ncbi:MAG: NAD-dependent epimerase/dehydratase family protein [Candidatus Manganitrophus sp.]|nr:NAD-dependent epimerase/dehydratase family protein [Candidatus Manganitrophus sp.]WDT69901.1 MAG: NAD-dependent epimerase/dehydratase family protein [Candidatus Manganitrophus sp.]WDT73884.1 MAG: NAD-dependent epimerase/dehydratase family protein [Candidatus Manganitrophus sp.]WDT78461.1 MAG: NAD-dependent epimerase/dehydratase family protein [Candidatus Manganitrophus sp.]
MRYFITGATGFVGGAIARQLAAAGHQVTALVRRPAQAHDLARLGIALHPGDITDKESMRTPMTGADGIFHVAGWYKIGSKTPVLGKKINVDGTRNVLELMRELRIPRGVYTSTLLVFSDTRGKLVDEATHYEGPWLSEYERTKWMAHTQIAEPMMKEGLPLMMTLPGLVYGPGDTSSVRNLLIQYLKGQLPISPQKTAYAWGHIEDIAKGHLLAMEKGRPGESYILAGPIHTLQEALAIAEQITGIKAPRLHPSPALLRGLSQIVRWLEPILPLPEFYRSESIRAIAGVTYIGSSKKAQRELGFTARPLEEGLCETLLHEMRLLGIRSKKI